MLVPGVGDVGELPRPRGPRPDDVRPDDGGQLDLHRLAGHPAGHLRDARLGGPPHFGGIAGRPRVRLRRPRRHGRRPAAGGHDERRRRARRSRWIRAASSGGSPRATSTKRPTASTRRCRRVGATGGATAWRGRSRCCGNAADVLPELVAARRRARRAHRPDLGARPAERLRAQRHDARRGRRRCAAAIPASTSQRSIAAMAVARARRCSTLQTRGAVDLRLRQQHPRAGGEGRRRRTRSTSPASCPSTSARCSARARGRSAGRRSRAIPADIHATDQAALEMFARRRGACAAGSGWPRERVAFQGLPARIFWLGYGERARFGLKINELVRTRRRSRRRSSSAAITSTPGRWPRRTARPRACATAAMPSPTGRSSTRC